MLNGAPTATVSGGEPLLYVAELLHRVSNEYASAISFASVMASRASTAEAKSALKTVIEHLVHSASAHRLLLPPVVHGTGDLGDYVTRLCQAKVAAELERRGTTLRLAVVSAVALDHARCWRVGLIVCELITNAARHGLPSGRGEIFGSVAANATQIVCRVSDNGKATAAFRPGLGTCLVDALAAELDGHIERRFGGDGATITLRFPPRSLRYPHWPETSSRSAISQPVGRIPGDRQPFAQWGAIAASRKWSRCRRRRENTSIH
jgi:two-component sensor histidine kinase